MESGKESHTQEPILLMQGITKVYPNGLIANSDVTLEVRKGEIHALVGENGAGKTTLMKILFGLEGHDAGDVFVRGKKVDITSPKDAICHGIGMVHQHFMLAPSLTVAENIVLGEEPRKGIWFDRKKAEEICAELGEKYRLNVDPHAKITDVAVGVKQRVEILKALMRGSDILVLDEPTAVLTPQETVELEGEDMVLSERLMNLLNDCDDVDQVYHNVSNYDDGEEDHHFMIFDSAHFPLNKFDEATLFFQLTVNYYKNKFDETIDKKEKNKNDEELLTARNAITSYSLDEIKELNEIKFKDKNFFQMVDKIDSIISH